MNAQALNKLVADNAGKTRTELLALRDADRRTVSPIPLADLRATLTNGNVLGNLMLAALSGSPDAATAHAYVNSANETIRSDLAGYAAQLDAMLTNLSQIGLTDPMRAEVIALGGGYAVRDATDEQVDDAIAADARDAAWHALNNARFDLDKSRSDKLTWLHLFPATPLPANLAALDAFAIPINGGDGQ